MDGRDAQSERRADPGHLFRAVLGERDGAINDSGSVAEGEDGGAVASSDRDDTRLHVIYRNAGDGSRNSGDAWSTLGWANSNGNASAWRR
ncbi:MAG: hypothetical protein DLM50_07650 [Candidatus Meridianibacter frigidus]|nr:MAG: hypothetical protein DLM50_07650 [Candidatus Eremiobacteraeota bacterium]